MRLALAALVASTGCAQIFGIDKTTGADANTDFATLRVQHVSIGASVIKTPEDLSSQMATFYDDSASSFAPVPGVLAGTDTFQAEVTGTPAAIYTLPDALVPTRMAAMPARAQLVNYNRFEHPNPQMPMPNSSLDVQVTLPTAYVAGETFIMQAIGAWMTHTLAPGPSTELPAPGTGALMIAPASPIAYSGFTSMIGGNPKYAVTAADVVLLLRYTSNAAGGGSYISGVFQAQFDQTDGADPVTGTMTAVPANTAVMAAVDASAFATRFAAVRPAVLGTGMGWSVNAAPGWSLGSATGVRLDNGNVQPADTMLMGMYGNPFESLDWRSVFTFTCSSTRTYAYTEDTTTLNVTLNSVFGMVSEPSATLDTANSAGLPILIEANRTTLVTDGNPLIVDPTQPVEVKATVDRPTNTAYLLTLVELGIDMTGPPAITRTTIIEAVTTGTPNFKLPPELFTVGKHYYFTVRSYQGGLAAAATGDLQTVSLPYTYAQNDSAVFIVGAP